jgi:hypothetical protein
LAIEASAYRIGHISSSGPRFARQAEVRDAFPGGKMEAAAAESLAQSREALFACRNEIVNQQEAVGRGL